MPSINQQAFFDFVCKHKDEICCLNPVHSDGEAKIAAQNSMGKVVKFVSSRGNEQLFYNGRQIGFFNQCFHNVNGEEKISVLLGDIWTDIDFGNTQNEGTVDFPNGKKPEALLARIIDMCTVEGDRVLDFHLGSGTTAAVAIKMNRKFIGIEQMDYINEISCKRIKSVITGEQSGVSKRFSWQGGGSFVYCELATANQRFVDEIMSAKTDDELTKIWTDMQQTGFLSWKIEPKQIAEHAVEFTELSIEYKKRFLIECLDKNMLYVPLSEINNTEFGISNEVKKLNSDFYSGF